jgi:hypothetical protein
VVAAEPACGRYLAPYLSGQVGFAAQVMPQHEHAVLVEMALEPRVPGAQRTFGELRDLSRR